MKKSRLHHALHNEEVCYHLDGTDYKDWVITTSFYSAVHFLHHALFPDRYDPGDGRMRDFADFQKFYSYYRLSNPTKSKHFALLELAKEHYSEIAPQYAQLMDDCWTARYYNYKTDKEVSDNCIQSLKEIKEACK